MISKQRGSERPAGRVKARWWWMMGVAVAIASTFEACSCEEGAGEGQEGEDNNTQVQLFPPGVNPAPAGKTNMAMLTVGGSKAQSVGVIVDLNGVETTITPPDAGSLWGGTVTLREGSNALTFYSVDTEGNRSNPSTTYAVILDTTAPTVPVLEPFQECVSDDKLEVSGTTEPGATLTVNGEANAATADAEGNFTLQVSAAPGGGEVTVSASDELGNTSAVVSQPYAVGVPAPGLDTVESPTDARVQTLQGTKAAGTGVALRKEGEDTWTDIVGVNGDTDWSYELELAEGENTFYLRGVQGDKEACGEVGPVTIIYSTVCPPDVDETAFPDDDDNYFSSPSEVLFRVTRCAGVSTWVRREGQGFDEATQLAPANEETSVEGTYALTEGENILYVFNFKDDLPSPEDGPFVFTLDTTPPTAPIITDPAGRSTETTAARVTLVGTKEAGANVCLRRDQDATCTEAVGSNGSTDFTIRDLSLNEGTNTLCVSSEDRAGNTSAESCVDVVRLADDTPAIVIQDPLHGQVIGAGTIQARATATSGRPITSVEICFDDQCAAASNPGGNVYTRTLTVPNNLPNGSAHTVTVRATNNLNQVGEESVELLYSANGAKISVTTPLLTAANPKVAVDGRGRLHMVWVDECSDAAECEITIPGAVPFDIAHRILDGGTWGETTLVSSGTNDGDSRFPNLAADGAGNIHLVWQDDGNIADVDGKFDVYYRSFNADTDAWSDIELVTEDTESDAQNPSVAAASDGSVYVAWEQRTSDAFEVRYAVRRNAQWGESVQLSDNPGSTDERNVSVVVGNDDVATFVWQTGIGTQDNDIVLKQLIDNVLDPDALVVTDNALDGNSFAPNVTVDSQNRVHIVWHDTASILEIPPDTTPMFDIFHRFYDGFGLSSYANLTQVPADLDNESATISVDPSTDHLYVAWISYDPAAPGAFDVDIFYTEGDVVGNQGSFFERTLVSEGTAFTGFGSSPDLVFDPDLGNLHIVWSYDPDPDGGRDQDVYHRGYNVP